MENLFNNVHTQIHHITLIYFSVSLIYEIQQPNIFIAKGLMCTRSHKEVCWCSKILQVDDNLVIVYDGDIIISQNMIVYSVLDENLEEDAIYSWG